MILYREIPKESTRKLLKLINKFSTVAGYRINMPKSVVSLYASNERFHFQKIKKIISLSILSKE